MGSPLRTFLSNRRQSLLRMWTPDSSHAYEPHVSITSFFTASFEFGAADEIRRLLRESLERAAEAEVEKPVTIALREGSDENASPVLHEWCGCLLATKSGYLLMPVAWQSSTPSAIVSRLTRSLEEGMTTAGVHALYARTRAARGCFTSAQQGISPKRGSHMSLACGRSEKELIEIGSHFADEFGRLASEPHSWDLVLKELTGSCVRGHRFADVARVCAFAVSVL